MKETYYFSHDYNPRSDVKIKRLLSRHGYLGYGIFWAIIEDLYNNANAMPADYEGIAFDMRTTPDVVKSIITDFGLFVFKDGFFSSESIKKRLEARNEKSVKARESAKKRWKKTEENANALRTHYEGNAIKESIRKESTVQENTEIQTPAASVDKKILKQKIEKPEIKVELPWHGEEFVEVWEKWKNFRAVEKRLKFKSPDSELSQLKHLHNLARGDLPTAIEIINQSIGNQWTGLFPIKSNNSNFQNYEQPNPKIPLWRRQNFTNAQ